MLSNIKIEELLKIKEDWYLYHRESRELEFKEQFNFWWLADYFRDFAAFANNSWWYLIFWVTDTPRTLTGLSGNSYEQFDKLDPEQITWFLLDIFSQTINWGFTTVKINNKKFWIFYIEESKQKPVIAKKDEWANQIIKNWEIYYRYWWRTQKIQFAELENIINHRIEQQNTYWIDLMAKIWRVWPSNAAILDTEKWMIEKNNDQVLVIDEDLTKKIKFIKEWEFSETEWEKTLKLVWDVVPIDTIEVTKFKKKNLLELYPFSAMQLVEKIRNIKPIIWQNKIWKIIAENDIKENQDYSYYNFRNRDKEEEYLNTWILPIWTPSLYNQNAIDYILKIFDNEN